MVLPSAYPINREDGQEWIGARQPAYTVSRPAGTPNFPANRDQRWEYAHSGEPYPVMPRLSTSNLIPAPDFHTRGPHGFQPFHENIYSGGTKREPANPPSRFSIVHGFPQQNFPVPGRDHQPRAIQHPDAQTRGYLPQPHFQRLPPVGFQPEPSPATRCSTYNLAPFQRHHFSQNTPPIATPVPVVPAVRPAQHNPILIPPGPILPSIRSPQNIPRIMAPAPVVPEVQLPDTTGEERNSQRVKSMFFGGDEGVGFGPREYRSITPLPSFRRDREDRDVPTGSGDASRRMHKLVPRPSRSAGYGTNYEHKVGNEEQSGEPRGLGTTQARDNASGQAAETRRAPIVEREHQRRGQGRRQDKRVADRVAEPSTELKSQRGSRRQLQRETGQASQPARPGSAIHPAAETSAGTSAERAFGSQQQADQRPTILRRPTSKHHQAWFSKGIQLPRGMAGQPGRPTNERVNRPSAQRNNSSTATFLAHVTESGSGARDVSPKVKGEDSDLPIPHIFAESGPAENETLAGFRQRLILGGYMEPQAAERQLLEDGPKSRAPNTGAGDRRGRGSDTTGTRDATAARAETLGQQDGDNDDDHELRRNAGDGRNESAYISKRSEEDTMRSTRIKEEPGDQNTSGPRAQPQRGGQEARSHGATPPLPAEGPEPPGELSSGGHRERRKTPIKQEEPGSAAESRFRPREDPAAAAHDLERRRIDNIKLQVRSIPELEKNEQDLIIKARVEAMLRHVGRANASASAPSSSSSPARTSAGASRLASARSRAGTTAHASGSAPATSATSAASRSTKKKRPNSSKDRNKSKRSRANKRKAAELDQTVKDAEEAEGRALRVLKRARKAKVYAQQAQREMDEMEGIGEEEDEDEDEEEEEK
ncbi:hypothetical protein MKZ38_004048 [Zalerion maritima]|uniref:Uncharacterized protein n=1 Tax=Zalerion maritima TaxID=339359 RepID=A0AAD5RLZ9_9PEZI|nr:hypothetical protein MKZ38_004048 [Zalerion maritima]